MFKLIFFFILVSACSTPRPEGKTEAEVLYKEAQSLREDGRYILAIEKLNNLRSHYPYSYFATHAELLQADILFDQESYVEAAAAYVLFKDFHPKYPKLDYVVWKIAESYYNQIPSTFDRDLSPAIEAIKYFRMLINRYPQSEYLEMAQKKIEQSESMLQKKEKYIADFYYKTEVYDAAIYRYKYIIKNFRSKELLDHSILRVVKSYIEQEDFKGCKSFYDQYSSQVTPEKRKRLDNAFKDCARNLN